MDLRFIIKPFYEDFEMLFVHSFSQKQNAKFQGHLQVRAVDLVLLELCLPPVRVGRHIVFPLASVGLSVCPSQNRVCSIT